MPILRNKHVREEDRHILHKKFSTRHLPFKPESFSPIALVGSFLLIMYVPYIVHGGFLGDDWDVWSASYFDRTFWRMLSHRISWFAPQRPFQAYILTMTGYLFKGTPAGYIIVNLCLWFASLVCIAVVIRSFFGRIEAILFVLFASIPVISSTTIFSPAATVVVPASIFFWSLSLLTLHRYLQTCEKGHYSLTYLLILIGLLIYEVFLPLLVLTICLPFIQSTRREHIFSFNQFLRHILKFVLPVLFLLAAIVMLHKLVAGEGATHIKTPASLVEVSSKFIAWARAMTSDFRNLIINSLFVLGSRFFSKLPHVVLVSVSLLALCYFMLTTQAVKKSCFLSRRKQMFFLLIVCLSLLSCPLMFILSGYPPHIYGYENRLMASTWILLCMIFSYFGGRLFQTRYWGITYLFILCCSWSMIVQRDNYIQSWRLQQKIAQDCAQKALETQVEPNAVVIGNVPRYLPNNLNNEEVFAAPWDFGHAIRIYTDGLIGKGFPVTATRLRKGAFLVKEDHFLIDRVWKPAFSVDNLWYYEYDQQTDRSEFIQITDRHHLLTILDTAERHGINEEPLRAQKGIRTWLKTWGSR